MREIEKVLSLFEKGAIDKPEAIQKIMDIMRSEKIKSFNRLKEQMESFVNFL